MFILIILASYLYTPVQAEAIKAGVFTFAGPGKPTEGGVSHHGYGFSLKKSVFRFLENSVSIKSNLVSSESVTDQDSCLTTYEMKAGLIGGEISSQYFDHFFYFEALLGPGRAQLSLEKSDSDTYTQAHLHDNQGLYGIFGLGVLWKSGFITGLSYHRFEMRTNQKTYNQTSYSAKKGGVFLDDPEESKIEIKENLHIHSINATLGFMTSF